jgi:glycosyltransferase involved in cell wall biosynthesis
MTLERLLFASVHGYLDPSSGAALATRDILELLAARGVDCRALCCGLLDYEHETPPGAVLDPLGVPYDRAAAALAGGGSADVIDLTLGGVRVTLLPTASSRADRAPNAAESRAFLDLADQVLARFRPQVVLTYGGHPANLALMARARRRGAAVVFHLHNFAYDDRAAFADAAAVLVPSEYARRFYARRLGLESTAIPYPLRAEWVVAADPEPRYLTFVNPQPAKGLTVFARLASELDRRRPDIPLLVVEGRGAALNLAEAGLDLSGLTNLHRMANTPDPRQFYRVSRAVAVPSLWRETFGRVAAEALANGLPVLASDRGALPSTLGEAGFVFTLPERCTPYGRAVPTAREVAPWLAAVERLWDDPGFEASHRGRAREASRRWDDGAIAGLYQDFFAGVASSQRGSQMSS